MLGEPNHVTPALRVYNDLYRRFHLNVNKWVVTRFKLFRVESYFIKPTFGIFTKQGTNYSKQLPSSERFSLLCLTNIKIKVLGLNLNEREPFNLSTKVE